MPRAAGPRVRGLLFLVVALAVTLPFTWPWQRPPLAQYMSQWVAFCLWALTLLVLTVASGTVTAASRSPSRSPLVRWFAMLALTAGLAVVWHRPPATVWLAPLATLGLATALVAVVSALDRAHRLLLLRALLLGVLVAAAVNGALVAVQVLRAGTDVRAAGWLAQPNHLATLVLWAGVAAVYLGNAWRCSRMGVMAALVPLIAVLVATQSRTGLVAACWLLAARLWFSGCTFRHRILARSLAFGLAVALTIAPLATVATLAATDIGLPESFSQRLTLWSNAALLIADAPGLGHGFGGFNRAWTLRPFAERAPDVFDHAHNLPLQWAVEFGLPLSALLLGGLAWLFWRHLAAVESVEGRAAVGLLFIVLLHSLTEHPLWFSYFLLPTAVLAALAAGFAEDGRARPSAAGRAGLGRRSRWALAVVATMMLAGAVLALRDYLAVARLNEAPLVTEDDRAARRAEAERVRGSVFFGHLGDYAAIMLAPGEAPTSWFTRPLHHVIDERLLAAYAQALVREGDLPRGRFIVERAREFPAHPAWQALPTEAILGGRGAASYPARPTPR